MNNPYYKCASCGNTSDLFIPVLNLSKYPPYQDDIREPNEWYCSRCFVKRGLES